MKRNIYIVGLAALLGSSLIGCTDMNEEVFSQVRSQDFHPSEKELPAIIAPAYSSFRSLMMGWQGYFDLQEEPGDEIITPVRPNGWDDAGTYRRMHQHAWNSQQWQPYNTWQQAYASVTTCNRVISQIEEGSIALEGQVKDDAIIELRAIRALAYYLVLDNHGNVPIVTDYKDVSLPEQKSRQEVYDFVVGELLEVIPGLTDQANGTYGRLNRWGAKALLAKIYLNAQVYTGTPQWDKVIEQADDIIASNQYVLDANYADVFSWTNETAKEIIFSVPYDAVYGQGNQIHMKTLDPLSQGVYPMISQPWGGNCAVPQFIDTYDSDDQRLYDTWIQGPQYSASTGQELINYVKAVPGMGGTDGIIAPKNSGYRIGKYAIRPGSNNNLDNDYPMFRYADVLMMKAEALLRTGRAEEAATLVTQVRQRAFKDHPEKATVTGAQLLGGSRYQYGYQAPDGTIDQVNGGADIQYGGFLDELGWEFAAEAHRRQDMIRFGVFQTKTWFNHRPQSQEATKIIFPIPQDELANNPNLTQNPGY